MSINHFLKQIGTGDTIKDYSHASKLFVGDNYRLAPRQGFLFHVFVDLNPLVKRVGQLEQKELGMLAKQFDLPRFSIDTKTINSYNKPNVVQTKIKYDPINITFHDDSGDVVRGLWYDYYNYYYRDSDLGYQDASGTPNTTYFQNTKYSKRDYNSWGYTPRQQIGSDTQFIKAIRLYSLSKKRFAEYTLINPTITSFRHGQHVAGSSEPMQHEMTIQFETVLYAAGWASDLTLNGFADIHYDTAPSPLTPAGGGTRSIIGPGGLISQADSAVTALGDKNYAGAFFQAFRGYQNLKNTNLKVAAKNELTQLGMDVLRGNNPLNKLFVPNSGNLANGSPIFQVTKKEMPLPPGIGNATSNGESVGKKSGLGPAIAGVALAGIGASILAGKKGGGLALAGGLVLGAGALNKLIQIDPKTGSVDKVGELPSKTAAETETASATGNAVSAPLNTNPANAATAPSYYEADGSISTADITQPTPAGGTNSAEATSLIANATTNAADKANPAVPTSSELVAESARETPDTKLNNVSSSTVPTNQGKI